MGANADVVREGWDAFQRQDLDGATEHTDDGAETVIPDSLPWGGTYRGRDGFKEMVGSFMSHLEDFRAEPEAFLEADSDHVVVPLAVSGRTTAGNDFSHRALWIYRLRDGKIVRAQFFGDTAETVEALGG